MPFIRESSKGIVLRVLVQPRSSKNAIVGLHGDRLKIKITAPPVDEAANTMCIRFLAKRLSVSPSSLEIISGHSRRAKQILVKPGEPPASADEYAHLKQRIMRLTDPKKALD